MKRHKTKKEDLPTANRKVLSLLRHGMANAITVREIISLTGYKDQEIRRSVQELVVKFGYLIGTSNDREHPGFYLIESEDERDATVQNLRGRIKQIYKRMSTIRNGELSRIEE
ncbi:hypothetical protein [Ammoniphilus resinae]|uniref:Uncharacterized protein n=1 Tax=Ammoniphilus resinae TaxID=861532 RepID=A0ABS4GX92_9BACL|nr:hypothetical protein [Ammoniphilus resinae]MBP1934888.1 hypothetical protein [Ammoniphilus resinae]